MFLTYSTFYIELDRGLMSPVSESVEVMAMRRCSLVALFLFAALPAWALFCQYCGKAMADDGRFCPKCGKAVPLADTAKPRSSPGSAGDITRQPPPATPAIDPTRPGTAQITPAMPEPATSDPSVSYGKAAPEAKEARHAAESLDRLIAATDRFARLLLDATTPPLTSSIAEAKHSISVAAVALAPLLPALDPYQRKKHALYVRKADLLQSYYEVWVRRGSPSTREEADLDMTRYRFALSGIDDLIESLKGPGDLSANLAKVAEREQFLDVTMRPYEVTSPYLQIEHHRVSRGHRIFITGFTGDRARVSCLVSPHRTSFSGWITLDVLERRTSWRSQAAGIVVSQQPAPTSTIVIVDRRRHGWHDGCVPPWVIWRWPPHRRHPHPPSPRHPRRHRHY